MTFFNWLLQYPRAVLIAVGAAIVLAFTTYMRDQILDALKWAFRPITARLPWNSSRPLPAPRALSSTLTLVDLRLVRKDGSLARYRKMSAYKAHAPLSSYREGVAASGTASAFRSARGRIVETVPEHGFYISKIDLGASLKAGEQFINVYEAELRNSFRERDEEWTQQISFETDQLVIQVHFPADRPPLSSQTRIVDGTEEYLNVSRAQVVELYRRKSLVWKIDRPNPAYIYKLAWQW